MSLRRRILIAGCGDLGGRVGRRPELAGDRLFGLRRRTELLPDRIEPVQADLLEADSLGQLPDALDAVIYTATPGERTEAAYREAYVDGLRNLLAAAPAIGTAGCRLILVSSTSVYGQDDGSWVDEDSPTRPEGYAGQRLLESEALAQGRDNAVIVRFSGIYGPGRTRLLDRVRARTPVTAEPPVWSNRIHSDDCAAVLAHLLQLEQPERLYLASDDRPALLHTVQESLASLLGLPAPPRVVATGASGGQRGRRCSNTRLRATGLTLRYPDYHSGYSALLHGSDQGRLGV